MISFWNVMILIVYVAGLVMSRGIPRACLWLGFGLSAYILSVAYWRTSLPAPEVFAGVLDAMIFVVMFRLAYEQWEVWIMKIFLACLAINLLYSVGVNYGIGLTDAYVMTAVLEVLNILVAGTTMFVAALAETGGRSGRAFDLRRSVFGLHLPSYEKAAADRWAP